MTNTFSTTDLDLAASLLTCGFPVENIMPVRGRAQFYFLTSKDFDEAVSQYGKRTLLVRPQLFAEAKKHIRSQLNDLNNNQQYE